MVIQLQEEQDAFVRELHGAPMERPNSGKILELTSMLSNAAEKMAEMTRGVIMTPLIEERIRSRYGLRGVRIGEASHRPDCCADILEGLAECTTFRPMKSH